MPNYGRTDIVVCDSNQDLGERAARAVAADLRARLVGKDTLRMVFAAGESQSTFCRALAQQPDIDWQRITCFNMDDFWDPRLSKRFTCGYQTEQELYRHVPCAAYHLVDFAAPDPQAEANRFAGLLQEGPIDLLCQGIGTSGHLALNEPDDSDFDDPRWVRVVRLVEQSKRQLRDDPNFRDLGYIPDQGITMTIPAMMSAESIYTIVPLALKKPILTRLAQIETPSTSLPASIVHSMPGTLFVDSDSCPDVWWPPVLRSYEPPAGGNSSA